MAEEHDLTIKQLRKFLNAGEAKELVDRRICYAKEKGFDNLIVKIDEYLKTINFK